MSQFALSTVSKLISSFIYFRRVKESLCCRLATLTRNAWETSDDFSASKSKTGVSTPYSREIEHDGGIYVSLPGLVLTVRGILVDTCEICRQRL